MGKLTFISRFAKIFHEGRSILIPCNPRWNSRGWVVLEVQSTFTPQAGEGAAEGTAGRAREGHCPQWAMSQPWQWDSATAPSTRQVTLLFVHRATNALSCFPAENTRGADPGCLTRNERVKGEGNDEEMWSQGWGVLPAQRGPELPAEGDGVRYALPCPGCPPAQSCQLGLVWTSSQINKGK